VTLRRLKDILFVLAVMGAVTATLRLIYGLGTTTALSDEIPWGLWKVLNMIAGVAVATGGFVLAFCVHVLRMKSLKPVLRPALLLAFLGYGASCAALMFDIGLPQRFWSPMVNWNIHSFLFEVFWCVMLYFTVTVIEVSPIALESPRFAKVLGILKKISLPVVLLGITFSTLHHTSLGSLFIVSKTRLHDLWWTPLLPLHFILSAVGAGLMAVVLLTLGVAKLYHKKAPVDVLRKLATASAVILSIYFLVKGIDLAARGNLGSVFSGEWESRLFLVEMLLAVVLPVALIAIPRTRATNAGLAAAAFFAVSGVLLNRLDVGVFGYFRSGGTTYFPSFAEIALTLGIPAAAGLFFFAFIERFRVFEFEGETVGPEPLPPVTSFQPMTGVWTGVFLNRLERFSLIAVVVIPLALAFSTGPAGADPDGRRPVRAPLAGDKTRTTLRIDGNGNGNAVLFPHADHKDRLGGEESCAECHHLDRPGDQWTSCHTCHTDMDRPVSIFEHDFHVERIAEREGFTGALAGNRTCAGCHEAGVVRNRLTAKACAECHEEDMRMPAGEDFREDIAPGYQTALHASCVGCHEERAEEAGRPILAECRTCHETGIGVDAR